MDLDRRACDRARRSRDARFAARDLEPRGPRRQRPAHGRLRDHPRPDDVHDARGAPRPRPLHGRVGPPGRALARRLCARHAEM